MSDDDIYEPEEPKYYKYRGKMVLNSTYRNSLSSYKKVNIFAYEVRNNNSSKVPFMQVLLSKSTVSDVLNLPSIPILVTINSKEELIDYVKVCLFGIIDDKDFEEFDKIVNFDGFYEYDNELFLFFDITQCKLNLDDIYLHSSLRFGLIDEIISRWNICNIPIDSKIKRMLFSNSNVEYLCYLEDKKRNKYEIPSVVYTSKLNNRLNYHYIFGETKTDDIFGTQYYFKDFQEAVKDACKLEGQSGVVRYAVILGTTKYVENRHEDPNDLSETKVNKLTDPSGNPHFERLTMRITDYDGKWTEKYDSIILGQVLLDNEEVLNRQITAVKDYEQQTPLSFHYVDKRRQGIVRYGESSIL